MGSVVMLRITIAIRAGRVTNASVRGKLSRDLNNWRALRRKSAKIEIYRSSPTIP
jgi:hypothetical protein